MTSHPVARASTMFQRLFVACAFIASVLSVPSARAGPLVYDLAGTLGGNIVGLNVAIEVNWTAFGVSGSTTGGNPWRIIFVERSLAPQCRLG